MGEFVNQLARNKDAIYLCTLVRKLRDVDTADRDSIRTFYTEMIEHDKKRKRLAADEPNQDAVPTDLLGTPFLSKKLREWEAQLRFLLLLEAQTRTKVSDSAANDLQQFADLLDAKIKLIKTLNETHT